MTTAELSVLYAEFVAENALWKAGDRWRQSRVRTLYVRWFRASIASGYPPDALDPWIEDETERFFSKTRQGADGHVFWDGAKEFARNGGQGIAPRRWWWIHLYGKPEGRVKIVQFCGEEHCIHPHHQHALQWNPGVVKYSEEQILNAIRAVGARLGRAPTEREFEYEGAISGRTVAYRFGSYNKAMEAAGFVPRRVGVGTNLRSDEELLRLLRQGIDKLGFVPSGHRWDAEKVGPSRHSYDRRFGSFREALRLVGE